MSVFDVCLFAVLWLFLSGLGVYQLIKMNNEDRDFFDQLMEIEKFVSPAYVSKCIIVLSIGILLFDVAGFCLAYEYAYAMVNDIYYRILFFFACVCIFLVEQTIALRYTMKVSSAIKRLEEKPRVLQRWIDMNEPNKATLDMLAAVTKFTIALQLFMFTAFV